ncbi:conjugation protein [Entomoplasma ellychniae]|uniref:Conjugation protein n=1 Tax=Entomoplasma ellychniae TaxID=2114 RepID=A0A8E2QVB5_9MOLU|nr:type IV secretory system conjugative DNA transfer family protein [Entomoplasma ellychniae]PPE04341.1 conjugation protein [Entomoplasma ellychniae]PPE04627.1 conjugation protein [Entomoplasma ellychniae]PPE04698.1 conjugation protein [Entomoplasma ellychniae]
MKLQLWNKIIKRFFLWQLLLAIPIAILIWFCITALLGAMSSKTPFNLFFVLTGKFNLMWPIFIGVMIFVLMLFLNWALAITIYSKFWRSGYRQHIDTKDITASKLVIDDRNIIDDEPKWKTQNGSIYDIKVKQSKDSMQNFNESLQIELNKLKSGFVVRNVWDAKAKVLNTSAASDVNGFVLGDPGSGKTAGIILPTIIYNIKLKNKSSMIINDPKGELYQKTSKTFIENGYEVKTFNLQEPNKSDAWNPLTSIFEIWQKYLHPTSEIDNSRKLGQVSEPKAMIQSHCNLARCYTHFSLSCKECIENLVNDHYIESNPNWYIGFIKITNENKNESFDVYFSSQSEMENWITQEKRKLKGETFGQIAELASSLYTTPDPKNEFFYSAAREFFEGTLQFMLALNAKYPKMVTIDNFNLKSIRKILSNKNKFFEKISQHSYDVEKAQKLLIEIKNQNKSSKKVQELESFISKNTLSENDWQTRLADVTITFKKDPGNVENWWKTLTNDLIIFDNIELENIICQNTINVEDAIKKPTVIFLIVPDNKKAYVSLVSLFVGQIYAELISIASKRANLALERKVLFILEEFGSMNKIDQFISAFSICRSRNINILICLQKESQLTEKYGINNTKSILGNCQLNYFVSSTERDDYEKYSKSFGIRAELKRSYNTRDNEASESLDKTALISADELQQLPKPLVAILLNDKKYISYLLPSWIGENEYIDYYGKKVYDHSPIENNFIKKKTMLYSEKYEIDLWNELKNIIKQTEEQQIGKTKPEVKIMVDENSNITKVKEIHVLDDRNLTELIEQLNDLRNQNNITPEIRRKIVELRAAIIKKQRINN